MHFISDENYSIVVETSDIFLVCLRLLYLLDFGILLFWIWYALTTLARPWPLTRPVIYCKHGNIALWLLVTQFERYTHSAGEHNQVDDALGEPDHLYRRCLLELARCGWLIWRTILRKRLCLCVRWLSLVCYGFGKPRIRQQEISHICTK